MLPFIFEEQNSFDALLFMQIIEINRNDAYSKWISHISLVNVKLIAEGRPKNKIRIGGGINSIHLELFLGADTGLDLNARTNFATNVR